jgi:dihydroorotase-like cyclic amidohydrolase
VRKGSYEKDDADPAARSRGHVFDHEADVHKPAIADILIEGSDITTVGRDLKVDGAYEIIDAKERLVVPGFIRASSKLLHLPIDV